LTQALCGFWDAASCRHDAVTHIAEHSAPAFGSFVHHEFPMHDIPSDLRVVAATPLQDKHPWRPERCDRVALVLQGGGALGAYQAGVYQAMHELIRIPEEKLLEHERELKEQLSKLPDIAILQIIYQQKAYEGHAKDHEFSGTSMREHWESGYEDTKRTLKHKKWLKMPPQGAGIVVHDVHPEEDY
jgi:hypothetical protein